MENSQACLLWDLQKILQNSSCLFSKSTAAGVKNGIFWVKHNHPTTYNILFCHLPLSFLPSLLLQFKSENGLYQAREAPLPIRHFYWMMCSFRKGAVLFCFPDVLCRSFLGGLVVKYQPAMRETQVWSLGREDPLEKGMQPIPVLLPWEFQGQRSLAGYSPWGLKESDMTEWLTFHFLSLMSYTHSAWMQGLIL